MKKMKSLALASLVMAVFLAAPSAHAITNCSALGNGDCHICCDSIEQTCEQFGGTPSSCFHQWSGCMTSCPASGNEGGADTGGGDCWEQDPITHQWIWLYPGHC